MPVSVLASANVTLAWNSINNPMVAGYNIYYGGASGVYTNKTSAGLATSLTVSNLANGNTYYFAATTYSAAGAESAFSSEVSYTVPATPVNQPPTLNPIGTVTINENAGLQTVSLSGISSGAANENQTLTVTAVSSNPALIPNPAVNYTSANTTGSLTFSPLANASGSATITVKVNDGGTINNLVTQTFTVTVNPITATGNIVSQSPTLDPIDDIIMHRKDGAQTVKLTGISPNAANNNPMITVTVGLSGDPVIQLLGTYYKSPSPSGSFTFAPTLATGVATVAVTVNDGGTSNNIITQFFTVTVLAPGAATNTANVAVVTSGPTNVVKAVVNSVGSSVGATLVPAGLANGQFTFKVTGAINSQYIVQASTDLVNWVAVRTNTAPFTFVETNASKFSRRYYRTLNAQ
jgi:hypothetical protein